MNYSATGNQVFIPKYSIGDLIVENSTGEILEIVAVPVFPNDYYAAVSLKPNFGGRMYLTVKDIDLDYMVKSSATQTLPSSSQKSPNKYQLDHAFLRKLSKDIWVIDRIIPPTDPTKETQYRLVGPLNGYINILEADIPNDFEDSRGQKYLFGQMLEKRRDNEIYRIFLYDDKTKRYYLESIHQPNGSQYIGLESDINREFRIHIPMSLSKPTSNPAPFPYAHMMGQYDESQITSNQSENNLSSAACNHTFADYYGFNNSFRYCTKCDKKEPLA